VGLPASARVASSRESQRIALFELIEHELIEFVAEVTVRHPSPSVELSDDDLVYLVADVLGTLREALLRVGSEIDAIFRKLDCVRGPAAPL
jgi:hypothetical protein